MGVTSEVSESIIFKPCTILTLGIMQRLELGAPLVLGEAGKYLSTV